MRWIVLVCLILMPFSVHAADVKIGWDYPDDVEVGGFVVYWGQESHSDIDSPQGEARPYQFAEGIFDETARQFTIANLSPGTWYFRLAAFFAGRSSKFSDELEIVIPDTELPAPDGPRIIIIVH